MGTPSDALSPIDVDECRTEASGCPEYCVNTAGSYWCQSWEGHCPWVGREPSMVTPGPTTGKLPACLFLPCLGWRGT